jgi:hypothetical protein
MKRYLPLFLSIPWAINVLAQGTVVFENINVPAGLNAPVYEADRITPLAGTQFIAELLGGPSPNSLTQVATTGFQTGTGAGYFLGGVESINTVAPRTTGWIEVEVWNTSSGGSFGQAQASGLPNSWWQSSVFSVTTGGGAVNPFPPAFLTGLGNSPVFLNGVVPEPSTFTLCVVGAVLVLLRSRRARAASFPRQETPGS